MLPLAVKVTVIIALPFYTAVVKPDDESSVALALLASEEAKLAFLEAAEAQKEYDEKYGEE